MTGFRNALGLVDLGAARFALRIPDGDHGLDEDLCATIESAVAQVQRDTGLPIILRTARADLPAPIGETPLGLRGGARDPFLRSVDGVAAVDDHGVARALDATITPHDPDYWLVRPAAPWPTTKLRVTATVGLDHTDPRAQQAKQASIELMRSMFDGFPAPRRARARTQPVYERIIRNIRRYDASRWT